MFAVSGNHANFMLFTALIWVFRSNSIIDAMPPLPMLSATPLFLFPSTFWKIMAISVEWGGFFIGLSTHSLDSTYCTKSHNIQIHSNNHYFYVAIFKSAVTMQINYISLFAFIKMFGFVFIFFSSLTFSHAPHMLFMVQEKKDNVTHVFSANSMHSFL